MGYVTEVLMSGVFGGLVVDERSWAQLPKVTMADIEIIQTVSGTVDEKVDPAEEEIPHKKRGRQVKSVCKLSIFPNSF